MVWLLIAVWRKLWLRHGIGTAGAIIVEPPPVLPEAPPEIPDVGGGDSPIVPDPGEAPINVIVHGLRYVWDDVAGWWEDAWHSVTGWFTHGISITKDVVETVVIDAIRMEITGWSSFINILDGYATTIATILDTGLKELTIGATYGIDYAINLAYAVGDYVGGVVNADVQMLLNTITGLETFLGLAEEAQTQQILQTVHDTVFTPLFENIGKAEAQATLQFQGAMQETARVESTIAPTAQLIATAVVAPALAAIAVQQLINAAQKTLNDECTTPMCDLIGPKTNFAKILKALEGLLAVGATGAILALTESDLERIASAFAGIGTGSLDTFLSGFVGGGETLGAAGVGLLGDVEGIASTVLSDLGIPV